MYRQTGNGSLLWMIAEAHAQAGRKDEALAALERAANLRMGLFPTADSPLAKLEGDARYDRLVLRMSVELPRVRRARLGPLISVPNLITEGIAADVGSGRLFLGHQIAKKILAVMPDGRVRTFAQGLPHWPLGMAVDDARRLLWVATTDSFSNAANPGSALLAFDLKTGRLQRTARSPVAKSLNDVTVAPDGAVFASDTIGGAVLRLRPGQSELEPLTSPGALSSPNGLALSEDGKFLFVAQGAALKRVTVANGEAIVVAQPAHLSTMGIDGLYWHEGRLIGIQNVGTPGRVLLLNLSPARDSVSSFQVLESENPEFDIPTTAAIMGGKLHLLANTQLTRLAPDGTISAGPALKPIRVLEIAIPR
jgi:hypothetical protein